MTFGRYPNLMNKDWIAWKREHWNDKVFDDVRRMHNRLSALRKLLKSSEDANAKSWALREGRETLLKMLAEEDKIFQGYFMSQKDQFRSVRVPRANERIFTGVRGQMNEMDHADWRDPHGLRTPKAKDLGQVRDPYGPGISDSDPYGPGSPDATDLGGDGTSWKPASEFIGDVGVSEKTKDNLWGALLVGFAGLVGVVIVADLVTKKGIKSYKASKAPAARLMRGGPSLTKSAVKVSKSIGDAHQKAVKTAVSTSKKAKSKVDDFVFGK